MDADSAAWKLILIYLVWLVASAAIALVGALLVAGVATFFGVEARSEGHMRIVGVLAVFGFLLLALVPFLVRRRMTAADESLEADNDRA